MADKRKYKRSKEEIAREFDLPERKSKIATILKQDDQAYCICRTSDCSRFMIGCDGCEEWYHGDCIGITEKEAKHIKQYYCRRCKKENPELQTIFRLVATERAAATAAASTGGAHSGYGATNASGSLAGQAAAGTSAGTSGGAGGTGRKNNSMAKETKAARRCGTCEGCRRPNCNQCDACRTRVGHKPRCIYRNCVMQAAHPAHPVATTGRKREKGNVIQQQQQRKSKVLRSDSPEIFVHPELEGLRQCHGPSCRCQARPQSAAAASAGMELDALPCSRGESRTTGSHQTKAVYGALCTRRAGKTRRGAQHGGGPCKTQFHRHPTAAGQRRCGGRAEHVLHYMRP
ncbi:CXXC-type zinc finger protein 1-like isoform X2 [Drosophila novamexicana]|uniref:CXXC-type zinc finger protein 1-like isoform X2 n=1 Tax=Drosophila novamexicana TaxID=47314 RepID=UPI0011E5D556|nr:CXXC-type zinc finger protein 1-like isoform X2 [Drosophila novamexicana]